jgi:hypothetical protein
LLGCGDTRSLDEPDHDAPFAPRHAGTQRLDSLSHRRTRLRGGVARSLLQTRQCQQPPLPPLLRTRGRDTLAQHKGCGAHEGKVRFAELAWLSCSDAPHAMVSTCKRHAMLAPRHGAAHARTDTRMRALPVFAMGLQAKRL